VTTELPVLVVTSSAHEALYREYLLKTLPRGLRVVRENMGYNTSDGSPLTTDWQSAMCVKVQHALNFSQLAEENAVFLVSDVDVQFFPSFDVNELRNYFHSIGKDMAFQKERYRAGDEEVCCGFYVAKNNEPVRELLERALNVLLESSIKNEQVVINKLLPEGPVSYSVLDQRFYARSHGFPPPPSLWMHHANCALSVTEKKSQLDRVARIARGSRVRRYWEAYLEQINRALRKGASIDSLVEAHRYYFRGLPLSPRSLP